MAVSETTAQRYKLGDPDVRLMLQVREDDVDAYEQLMLRYQGRLLTLMEHLVQSHDLAEDLAQEVFLRIYRARTTYVPEAKFSTWLFTIANNVASNALRTLSRRKEVNLQARESGPMGANPLAELAAASSGQLPTRLLDKDESEQVVRMAVASLSERQRLAVLLSKFEGMSYADIAEVMDLSPQAVKSLLSRARTSLRTALAPYLERGDQPEIAKSS